MPIIQHNLTINRPISDVFSYVADFTKSPNWQKDVVKVWQTEEKARVGVMVTQSRRLRVVFYQLDLNADIVEYQLNKKIELKGTTGFFPIILTYTFEPSGRSTRITETMDIRMWGPHRLMSSFVSGAMKRRAERSWNNLKQLLEAGGTQSS